MTLALLLALQSLAPVSLGNVGQNQIITIGILSFQDDSGTGAPPEFGRRVAQDMHRRLVTTAKDTLPRLLSGAAEGLSVEQLAALGKQQGVQYVVRGGLLSVSAEREATTVHLYAEVIAVDSAISGSVRAEGTGAGQNGNFDWAKVNVNGNDLRNSGFGQALAAAVEQLTAAIYQSLLTQPSPKSRGLETTVSQETSSEETIDVTSEMAQASEEDAQAASNDEELQQLIAQAESLIAGGVGNRDSLKALGEALMNLKSALENKASLLGQAQDTSEVDQQIATHKDALQAAVATLTEQAAAQTQSGGDQSASGESTGDGTESSSESSSNESSGEKQSMMAKIGGYVGEALSIMQKIQEMRSLMRSNSESYQQSESYAGFGEGAQGGVTEEMPAEVSGVITEEGAPVEGAMVFEPETGATATTDSNGAYTLPLVAGRLAKLTVSKSGKSLASGQVDLLRGRQVVADFNLKAQAGGGKTAARVTPSTAIVSPARSGGKNVGTLKGQIKDPQGKPVARALVSLKGLAVARTDSNGQYAFLNVPAGTHQLTVIKSGLNLKTQQVQVAAKKSSETPLQFAAGDQVVKPVSKPAVVVRGGGVALRGAVFDTDRRPLGGVKLTATQTTGAVSVFTNAKGSFELKDLKPGSYRLLVAKAGFDNLTQAINLRSDDSRDFVMKKSDSTVARTLELQRLKLASGSASKRPTTPATKQTTPVKPFNSSSQPVRQTEPSKPTTTPQPAFGQIIGRVVDEQGKPLAGAIIAVQGQATTRADAEGRFTVIRLEPGSYRLNVSRSGFAAQTKSLAVRGGGTTREEFVLKSDRPVVIGATRLPQVQPARPGNLRGQVVDARTGKTLAAVVIAIAGQRSVTTDQAGVFAAANLPAGVYQLVVRKAGYSDAKGSISIRAGETASTTIRLNPAPSPTVRPRLPVRLERKP